MSSEKISDHVHLIDSPYHGARGVLGTYTVKGESCAIIDPGPPAQVPGVLEALEQLGVTELERILLTHIHLDHAAGCWAILEAHPDAEVHCHPRGAPHMADPTRIEAAARATLGDAVDDYGGIRGLPPGKVHESSDGESIDLGGVHLEVLWTPGHSTHSQAYHEPEEGILFAGDAAGHYPGNHSILIPAAPPPHNPRQAVESLDRLIALKPQTICISHFGFRRNAVEHLERFRDQTLLWTDVATMGVEEGLRLSAIFEKIIDADPMARRLASVDEESKRAVYSSLVGFVEYAKWLMKQDS